MLAVAPKRVAEHVWKDETALWRPDLTFASAKGSPAAREAALRSGADVVALGRDNLKDLERVFPKGAPFRTVILDELSGFKSRQSQRWKAARRLTSNPTVKHVWGLTGTPTPNGLMDLWAQIALLDGGERLGKNLTTYRSRYFTPGRRLPTGIITEWLLREQADARIRERIADICLSMESEGRIELPPVTFNRLSVQMPKDAVKVYRDMERDLVADLRDIFAGEIHTAANAAVLTSKLSQIAAGFLYVDDADLRDGKYSVLHGAKVDAALEVVEAAGGSPVLVFYRFRAELDALRRALPAARTVDEPGVIDDWNAGRVPVMLAHPASAGHGLNLQHGGHTIVWTSLPWSSEEWEQANKRLARQGQKHPVVIHQIMATGTVDSAIRTRLDDKISAQDALLAYLESPV